MKDEEVELMRKKILAHHKSNLLVHVVFKNGSWKNGLIIEISADFFMLDELFEGRMPVFYQEIDKVETYNQNYKKKVGDGKQP